MTDENPQIDRIREKLARVKREGLETFGAQWHRYELGPPLPEAEVRAFEVTLGVTIPQGYRDFVTQIGHHGPGPYGGAGPYYGLYSLEDWDDFTGWITEETPMDWLRRPSPLRPGSNELPDIDHQDATDEEWDAAILPFYQGVATIGTRGCTYVTGLVITGESRGRVVYLDAEHFEPPYVVRDEDFLDWYERWLDELLEGYDTTWFGYGPAGDEETLLGIIETSGDAALVAEAIGNLHKLPALSERVWEAVAPKLRHSKNSVRARAVRLLRKSPRAGDIDLIASRWSDADVGVRAEVIRALMDLAPDAWHEATWQLLGEDEELREDCFAALREAKCFSNERLFQLLDDPSMAVLHARSMYLVDWQPAHRDRLSDMLSADEAALRREAAYALSRLGVAPRPGTLVAALEREKDEYAQSALVSAAVALEVRDVAPRVLEIATDPDVNDFQRLGAVDALCKLGDDRVMPVAEEMLTIDRTPVAPNRGHQRTIAELVRDSLEASASPKLRALGKVV